MNWVLVIYHTLLLNSLLHLCMGVGSRTHTCHGVGEVVRKQFWGVRFSPSTMGSQDWTQLTRLCGKTCLATLLASHTVIDTGNRSVKCQQNVKIPTLTSFIIKSAKCQRKTKGSDGDLGIAGCRGVRLFYIFKVVKEAPQWKQHFLEEV